MVRSSTQHTPQAGVAVASGIRSSRIVSLGTWQAAPGVVAEGVYHALKVGYRLLDCAYCYGNEAEVGQGLARAIKEGIVKREDVFVVTKVWYALSRSR